MSGIISTIKPMVLWQIKNRIIQYISLAIGFISIWPDSMCQEADYSFIRSDYMIFEPTQDYGYIPGCYGCSNEKYLIGIRMDSFSVEQGDVIYYPNWECLPAEALAQAEAIYMNHKKGGKCPLPPF